MVTPSDIKKSVPVEEAIQLTPVGSSMRGRVKERYPNAFKVSTYDETTFLNFV